MTKPLTLQPPPPIRVGKNDFATHTLDTRIPKILRDVETSNPDYPPQILNELAQVRGDLESSAPIPMLNKLTASDYEMWEREYQRQAHLTTTLTWGDCEWFFAETYLYRYLMQVVRWFETNRDPFAPAKQKELESEQLWEKVEEALKVEGDFGEKLSALLLTDLWGNRADLSHSAAHSMGTEKARDSDVLVDDRPQVVEHLTSLKKQNSVIHIVCDNTGTELALDLVLVDHLLASGIWQVVMHLKAHPTFVSDALPVDVWQLMDAMAAHSRKTRQLAQRLRGYWPDGRLRLAPHIYWNSPHFLWSIPVTLEQVFEGAALVIFKGDANYRRAVGDALWQPETPLKDVVAYFNAPLLTLRTMKSDAVVGLPVGLAAELDKVDSEWRVNGKRGVIQFARA